VKPLAAILITFSLVMLLWRAARAFDWALAESAYRYVELREWIWKMLEG
jgi:hypothetical protein